MVEKLIWQKNEVYNLSINFRNEKVVYLEGYALGGFHYNDLGVYDIGFSSSSLASSCGYARDAWCCIIEVVWIDHGLNIPCVYSAGLIVSLVGMYVWYCIIDVVFWYFKKCMDISCPVYGLRHLWYIICVTGTDLFRELTSKNSGTFSCDVEITPSVPKSCRDPVYDGQTEQLTSISGIFYK